jgi:enoyl-CoA hydratase
MATTHAIDTKELVKYRVQEGIAIFELDDRPANTYTYEMMKQLDAAILKARMDEHVQVILIRGAGEKFFSAGASIPMLTTADPTFKYYFCLHAKETLCRLEQTPKLVIAALNGHTVGGGLEIALACDIRIAKKDGGKIGLPEVRAVVTGSEMGFGEALGIERELQQLLFTSEDAKEGLATYVEKRAPHFKGK